MLLDKDFVMQGGVRNYLGKTKEVNNAPRYWQSSPTSPKTELSYITDAEKQLLLNANLHGSLKDGKPNKGASGLLSFDGGGFGSEGAGTGGSDGFGGGGGDGGDNSPGRNMAEFGTPTAPSTSPSPSNDNGGDIDVAPGEAPVTQQEIDTFNETSVDPDTRVGDDAKRDYLTTEYLDINLTPEQKKEFEEYREGVSEAITPSTKTSNRIISSLLNTTLFPFAGNLYNAYIDATAMGYSIPNPFDGLLDGNGFFSGGDITAQLQNIQDNNGGDGGDGNNNIQDIINTIISKTTQTPNSMVNQYFANMGNSQGSPLSSDLQTSYNNAKNSVNNILGITPPSQQFGLSAQPYGLLNNTNMANNPFNIPYLQQRGLI